jgi:hypothetical protein
MNSDDRIEEHRREVIDMIENSDFVPTISMVAWPESLGYRFPGSPCDVDGDTVIASATGDFPREDYGLVRAQFPKGTDPSHVARVLRKFAEMLEGPSSHLIVALGIFDHDIDTAQRLPDGEVVVFNHEDEIERRRSRSDRDATSPEDGQDDS